MNVLETAKFNLNYTKIKPLDLKHLEESFTPTSDDLEHNYNAFHISHLQNYNPLYSEFFIMNETNYDKVALNNKYHIQDLNTVYDTETKETMQKPVFIKFSPLLDPIRYMIGKYNINDEKTRTLPNLSSTNENTLAKILNKHNASYVDNFFSFLTSKLLHEHGFVHGLDYYGSFLGVQEKFKMNIVDDLEYLNTSDVFLENIGKHYSITKKEENMSFMNYGSRANKHKLNISNTDGQDNLSVISISEIEDLNEIENLETNVEINDLEEVYEKPENSNASSPKSSNSSNNSETNYSTEGEDEEEDDEKSTEEDDEDDSTVWETDDSETSSEYSEESAVYSYINNYPVQLICLEKCDGTLDELFMKHKITVENASSMLFQVVMTLLTYQKAFHFTHNDLHTNNIMYMNTDIDYLYYKFGGKIYKVPTFGKIFKIIDFGRGIYKFNGQLFCSDSFNVSGDAHTQYNFEPFMNENKPRLEPNYSFDLCRLATSIYDFVVDTDEKPSNYDDFQTIINNWCCDDNGKNVLYKRDGSERYEGFKMYKMIARFVHGCVPIEQLKLSYFMRFEVDAVNEDDSKIVMDIDAIPSYVSAI
jgi:ribosomal protein L12E/L44/L45/RPP1/RPP2